MVLTVSKRDKEPSLKQTLKQRMDRVGRPGKAPRKGHDYELPYKVGLCIERLQLDTELDYVCYGMYFLTESK